MEANILSRTASPTPGLSRPALLAVLATLALLTFVFYFRLHSFFFTGADTLFHIDYSRIGSSADLQRILSQPLLGYDYHIGGGIMYRPLTNLQYASYQALWGSNATLYHLADILLHFGVVVLVFQLGRMLFRSNIVGWLGAVIFALHPAVSRSMIGPAGAGGMLMSFWLLMALILLIEGFRRKRQSLVALSLFSYLLALLSKELAAALWPLFILAFPLVLEGNDNWRTCLFAAVRKVWFYPALAVFYFVIRLIILDGLGGYEIESSSFSQLLVIWQGISTDYLRNLVSNGGSLFAETPMRYFSSQMVTGIFVLSCCMVAVSGLITARQRHLQPVNPERWSLNARAVLFLAIWIMTPFILAIVTRTYSDYNAYFPAIAFSILVSFCLVTGVRECQACWRKSRPGFPVCTASLSGLLAVIGLVAVMLITSYFSMGSLDDGHVPRTLYDEMETLAAQLPEGGQIEIYDFPRFLYPFSGDHALFQSEYNLKSWIGITHPGKNVTVNIRNFNDSGSYPKRLQFREEYLSNSHVILYIEEIT